MTASRLRQSRERGYTLLEVLIALVVFSVGLLGLAAMLLSAVKGNHKAYYHSQAVNVAQSIGDGMRSNVLGLWNDDYNTGFVGGGPLPACAPCTPAQVAAADIASWGRMASTLLPNGEVAINCTRAGLAVGELKTRPTFDGVCRVNVRWSESGDVGDTAAARQETFTWIVQP